MTREGNCDKWRGTRAICNIVIVAVEMCPRRTSEEWRPPSVPCWMRLADITHKKPYRIQISCRSVFSWRYSRIAKEARCCVTISHPGGGRGDGAKGKLIAASSITSRNLDDVGILVTGLPKTRKGTKERTFNCMAFLPRWVKTTSRHRGCKMQRCTSVIYPTPRQRQQLR